MAWGGLDFQNNSTLTDDDKDRIQNRLSAEMSNKRVGDAIPSSDKSCK